MGVRLSDDDRALLAGDSGEASRLAMSIILRMAEIAGATELVSIEAAHIDACALMSPSSLEFVEQIVAGGGRFRVPTTLSMVSLDLRHWQDLGVPSSFGEPAVRIAKAYLKLGGIPSWTCAPYQGYLTPRFGQQIAWGESNAVAYANSVLGARTNRYADYMDVCAAITGRVPHTGLHRRENRAGQILLRVHGVLPEVWRLPSAWAALGHLIGDRAGDSVPVIEGLPASVPNDGLKAFGAAAASSGGVALYHLVGITPEAPDVAAAFQGERPTETIEIQPQEIAAAWESLTTTDASVQYADIDAVILGCPHTSYAEFEALAAGIRRLGRGVRVHANTQFLVVTHETAYALAVRSGLIEPLKAFGATIVFDTCPFHSPIVREEAATIMTNSGKCAYYAPGELGVHVIFGTLDDCLRSAVAGSPIQEEVRWTASPDE